MDWLINTFLHLDKTLNNIIGTYQAWTYLILFVVIFCETGLVVTPILPGDSLLFSAGTLAGSMGHKLDVWLVFAIMSAAAVSGDSVNYWIGRLTGPKIFHKEKVRLLNKEYLNRAHAFYLRHGGKTVVIARFMPILRTFAPFVAGIGKMSYPRFLAFSASGTLAWMSCFIFAGYFFGSRPFVQHNFTYVVMGIIVISLIPAGVGFVRARLAPAKGSKVEDKEPAAP